MSDAVHSIRHKVTLQITEQLSRQRHVQEEHSQTFKMERFAKRIMPECRRATRNFSEQGRFRGTRTLRYTSCQKHRKGVFSP